MERRQYSYRDDPGVPRWDDMHGLIVFDGECVLCCGFVQFVLRHDTEGFFRFTTAQSPLGQALYKHYDYDTVDFETNLVIADGRLHSEAGTLAEVGRRLGWPWKLFMLLRLLPSPLANWFYRRIAKNRFTLFGRRDTCLMPSALEGRYVE